MLENLTLIAIAVAVSWAITYYLYLRASGQQKDLEEQIEQLEARLGNEADDER